MLIGDDVDFDALTIVLIALYNGLHISDLNLAHYGSQISFVRRVMLKLLPNMIKGIKQLNNK
jgi:hypothetical protein